MNVRLSYADCNNDGVIQPSSEVLEENNYYPFGLKHQGYNDISNSCKSEQAEKYQYNGKEFEDSFGLNIYEMDLRQYDPAIGRWTVQDPVVHHEFSPYSAFDNNPVYWADPSGADAVPITVMDLFNATENGSNASFQFSNGRMISTNLSVELASFISEQLQAMYEMQPLEGNDHEVNKGNGGGNGNGGGLQQNRKNAVTLTEWINAYKYFSQKDIALERGKDKYGLPLGPSIRFVINPYDNNVMDMRHVVVVGYGMGEVNGLGAEIIQYIAGLFGKDPTNSAFNEQDKYSNNIGDSFRNYDYTNYGIYMSYDFAQRFGEFLKTVYNK